MSTPQIWRVLDASSSHVPQDVWDRLAELGGLPLTYTHETWPHAYMINVPSDDVAEALAERHPVIARILAYAHDLDCHWVMLDVDAEVIDGLPVWEVLS